MKNPDLTMARLIQMCAIQAAQIALLSGSDERTARGAYLDAFQRFDESMDRHLLMRLKDETEQYWQTVLKGHRLLLAKSNPEGQQEPPA